MKIWHDDIRPAPEGWTWARTNADALRLLLDHHVDEISLDHDLGLHHFSEAEIEANEELIFGRGQAEETGLDLVTDMIQWGVVPETVTIHSWNPAGARRMQSALADVGSFATVRPFVVPNR